MGLFARFMPSEADIIKNRKDGVVYVADFSDGTGKYVSITESGTTGDFDVKISPRIHLRVTYINKDEKIKGVEIAKIDGGKVDKVNFSTLDFKRILQLLSLFAELDLKAVVNKSVILDKTIIGDSDAMSSFLKLIASDPQGKVKISEIANNYGLINVGDIDNVVQRREAVELFNKILNSQEAFVEHKSAIRVGKDEEVWQRFFSKNSWILGSDFVEILDERRLDVENITDYLLKSFDGFVDIIELKLPSSPFWTTEFIPKSELTAATMQRNRYILQTERKINDLEFSKKVRGTQIVKPRITLIYGRSNSWRVEENEAYRVLNSSYTTLNIITYDHLLERAKRLIGESKTVMTTELEERGPDDVPF